MLFSHLFVLTQIISHGASPTVPNPSEVSYYAGLPIGQWPHPKMRTLKVIFFDYDGTIEVGDALSPNIFQRLGAEPDGDPSRAYSGQELINEFNVIKQEMGEESFKNEYFGGAARVQDLKTSIERLRTLTNGEVNMLSARWTPITGAEWGIFVHHVVTEYLGLGFTLPHVIGVDEKLSTGAYDKGGFMKTYLDNNGKSSEMAIHADNSFKYIHTIMGNGADFLWVKTSAGITKNALDLLIERASGNEKLMKEAKKKSNSMVQVSETLADFQHLSQSNLLFLTVAAVCSLIIIHFARNTGLSKEEDMSLLSLSDQEI